MTLHTAMVEACQAVQIEPPRTTKPGEWVRCPVVGKSRSNRSGSVLIFDDQTGGISFNWATHEQQRFTADGLARPGEVQAPKRDEEELRRKQAERAEAQRICGLIVQDCRQDLHPYLERKGFPEELGLVHDDPRRIMPDHDLGQAMRRALGDAKGPFLIVPGRIAKQVVTVQFIDAEGQKLNAKGAPMSGTACRLSSGRETWVCEGYATALSVRDALRMLGRSATVLSAFSAANVAKVAKGLTGAIIAADHDKPLEQLHGKGTGEFFASKTGCTWTMPPTLGDFNDMQMSDGLRAVALHLRGV